MEERYRFVRLLGQGAMGEVYLAEHTALGRHEAVKILRPELATDPQFIAGFRREARATNRVQHPNIVGVYDFGKLADGRFYLAMEYAEGTPLDTLLVREERLPVARALPILVQLTDAVGCAHTHGVIHRDLKPGNLILVEHRGQPDFVKVLDFGMAKILGQQASDGPPLSRAGAIMGTPTYMAPEHIIGRTVDGRADLYAIGCIAYEMLTGRPPFTGKPMEVADAHLSRTPAPTRATVVDIPAALDELVLRCLEKSPDKRVATAQELKLAFEGVLGPQPRGKGLARAATAPTQRAMTPLHNDFETADTGVGADVSRRADGRRTERQLRPITQPQVSTSSGHHDSHGYRNDRADRAERDDRDDRDDDDHLRVLLLRAAEALLDRGHSHSDLIFAVVEVKEAEQDRHKLEHELAEVGGHLDDVEQDAREREAALRFALSDLEFERDQQRGAPDVSDVPNVSDVDVNLRIQNLSDKLARIGHQRDKDILRLTEQSVSLTAELATLEERLTDLYARLDNAVNQGISRNPA